MNHNETKCTTVVLDQAWQALWAEVPIEVLAPDAMLAWLEARENIVTLIGRQREAQRQFDDSRREEQEAIAQVHAALTRLGWDAEEIEANTLRVMVERADAYRRDQVAKAEKIDETREAVRTAKSEVARRQGELQKAEAERKNWQADWALVQPLLEAASVEDVEELRAAIERSDRLRTLNKELAGVMDTLDQQDDGLAIEVIEEECRDIDFDEVGAREEAAEAELKVLGEQLEEAVVARTEARKAFEAIEGDDAAARVAADYEETLAAMQDAAERYVRVRTSGMLLSWAVERYRKEKQGPLLKRAGELFRVLTRNSFERLEVGFDERDAMHLTGMRPDGEVVAMPSLSTGTEDQLFLALRIAAVEDYLARAVALPFVTDDLFINFDPERSAAGFEVLGQLGERTQVLFYTHHPHLVDVARETLGADVHVVTLADAA